MAVGVRERGGGVNEEGIRGERGSCRAAGDDERGKGGRKEGEERRKGRRGWRIRVV